MSNIYLDLVAASGASIKATLQRIDDGYYRAAAAETFSDSPSFAAKGITYTAGTGENTGYYEIILDSTAYDDGLYRYRAHDTSLSNKTIGTQLFYVKNGEDLSYFSENVVYYCDINFSKDSTSDKYTVIWYKNGAIIDSGDITDQKLTVFKRDGTDLVPETSIIEITGGTNAFSLDISIVGQMQTAGENYIALATATIEGDTRSYSWVLGRDY